MRSTVGLQQQNKHCGFCLLPIFDECRCSDCQRGVTEPRWHNEASANGDVVSNTFRPTFSNRTIKQVFYWLLCSWFSTINLDLSRKQEESHCLFYNCGWATWHQFYSTADEIELTSHRSTDHKMRALQKNRANWCRCLKVDIRIQWSCLILEVKKHVVVFIPRLRHFYYNFVQAELIDVFRTKHCWSIPKIL